MLIGLVIDDRGLVPDLDVKVLGQFGQKVKGIYRDKIDEVSGQHTEYILDTGGSEIGAIVIMEDIAKGHRILDFSLYGLNESMSELIFRGQTIGHKRIIDAKGTIYDKIKLIIEDYRERPHVKSFAAYHIAED